MPLSFHSILNKLTPENYDHLKGLLIDSALSTDTKEVVLQIFDLAVMEPKLCHMYALLCSELHVRLPPCPPEEEGPKEITFRRVLLNLCQKVFECSQNLRADLRQITSPDQELVRRNRETMLKLRNLGNICLIVELYKQKMLTARIVINVGVELLRRESKSPLDEENVEALCVWFNTVGKLFDERPNLRCINDAYFERFEELVTNPQLAPRLRIVVRDTLHLRSNNWVVPRQEQVPKNDVDIGAELAASNIHSVDQDLIDVVDDPVIFHATACLLAKEVNNESDVQQFKESSFDAHSVILKADRQAAFFVVNSLREKLLQSTLFDLPGYGNEIELVFKYVGEKVDVSALEAQMRSYLSLASQLQSAQRGYLNKSPISHYEERISAVRKQISAAIGLEKQASIEVKSLQESLRDVASKKEQLKKELAELEARESQLGAYVRCCRKSPF